MPCISLAMLSLPISSTPGSPSPPQFSPLCRSTPGAKNDRCIKYLPSSPPPPDPPVGLAVYVVSKGNPVSYIVSVFHNLPPVV